jgi:hypothetical protein
MADEATLQQGDDTGRLAQRLAALARRRIWLSRPVYAAVPWFYLASGTAALGGGLFLPDGTWFLPYLLLLGGACVHAAVAVGSLRHGRNTRADQPARDLPAPLTPPTAKLPE